MINSYINVKCGDLTNAQRKKFERTGKIAFTAAQVKSNERVLALHPMNAKSFKAAQSKAKGCNLTLAPGEVMATVALENDTLEGGSLEGGSVFSWLKKKAWPWLKSNWNILKPVASAVADVGVPFLANMVGASDAAAPGRKLLKDLTGVGVDSKKCKPAKGSPEMKAKMAALRARRKLVKSGGSFTLA